jgi:hypothetical protein
MAMPVAKARAASQTDDALAKDIFIVYEKHEVKLAEALKQLFEHWHIGTFYCRQEFRGLAVSAPYRSFLAEELSKSRLVILLLSRSFQWSPYCQAEAGASATLNKPMIPVLIPPSTLDDVKDISPVLEGLEAVVVAPTLPHWRVGKLSNRPSPAENADKWEAHDFINVLQSKVLQALNVKLHRQENKDVEEARLRGNVEAALRWVIEDNLVSIPERETLSIWPSIDNTSGSLAPASVIENIKRSLTNSEIPTTSLHVAGVSLKFSLNMITIALKELAHAHQTGVRPVMTCRDGRAKRLKITLVHMDDQSHILHALEDQIDIRNILKSFHKDWFDTSADWRSSCTVMGIDLLEPELHCIDYIPPRIGIMIDHSILYAGRCSFPQKSATEFQLRVGENEYFFYERTSDRGIKEIDEFEEYLAVYSRPTFYGVPLVPDGNQWIRALEECVDSYQGLRNITLISQTCTKFEPLIKRALIRGLVASIYVQHPESAPPDARRSIEGLPGRIRRMTQHRLDCAPGGGADIYYYRHSPTCRVAAVGDDVLGVQLYLPQPPDVGTLAAGDLRLIVKKHSAKYPDLKRELNIAS